MLDFLLEDVSPSQRRPARRRRPRDPQEAQAVVKEHLVLEPVLSGEEERPVEVKPGFDPSAISVTGNVTGSPPFRGVLDTTAGGCRSATSCRPRRRVDDLVIAPAEVEIP
ncbi:MAG: DUF2760 domain-containing protein [Gemmataceae bacterium]